MTEPYHRWRPIEDLPEPIDRLADPEFSRLLAAWRAARHDLADSDALARLNRELVRELAIETGVIEGLYSIDRGTTENLIRDGLVKAKLERGTLSHSADEIHRLLKDHESATEGVFDFVKGERSLSISYVRELHAHLTRHQPFYGGRDSQGRAVRLPMIRGDWKDQPNNPLRPDGFVHEYCPPLHVGGEMERLVAMALTHREAEVPADAAAAWLHHRFTQIHPFADGNGRVARLLATMVFVRAGGFPLSISRDERAAYIAALETADAGDLRPLVAMFAATQKRHLRRALTLHEEIAIEGMTLDEIAARARASVKKIAPLPPGFEYDHFQKVCDIAFAKLSQAVVVLNGNVADGRFVLTWSRLGNFVRGHDFHQTLRLGERKDIQFRSHRFACFGGLCAPSIEAGVSREIQVVPYFAVARPVDPIAEIWRDRTLRVRAEFPFEEELARLDKALDHEVKRLVLRLEQEIARHA